MARNWISDRLPTIYDADEDGDVLVRTVDDGIGFRVVCWNRVTSYQAWAPLEKPDSNPARKVAQLFPVDGQLIALSDDGAIFRLCIVDGNRYKWMPLPLLPQQS